MSHYSGSFLTPIVVTVLFAIAVICFVLWGLFGTAFGADTADPPCLTKEQAKAKYPGAWLYWHGPNRCWDNRSTRQAGVNRLPGRYSVNKNPMQLGKPPIDPSGNVARHGGKPLPVEPPQGPTVAYPALMPGGGIDDVTMLEPTQMTRWPLVMDFDEDPPQFIPWQKRFSFLTAELSAAVRPR